MTNAVEITLAHFNAWTGGDFEEAVRHLSPDIVCDTPNGTITGLDAYRGFMGPFAASLQSAKLLAAFGDDQQALIMYDAATALVADAPGAELHTIRDGLITSIKIIFDRQPFVEARQP